jgi:hypothetical protein
VLQITPQMRVLVALEAVDGRKGIVFRSRSATSIRLLAYDGQGFWLAQKRLSKGRFLWWPGGQGAACSIEAYQAQLLVAAGNPDTPAAPMWRRVS